MKEIKAIKLKKSDYLVLNDNDLSALKGGERTKLGCILGQKLYLCATYEASCPGSFTTGDCGMMNMSCEPKFSITTL